MSLGLIFDRGRNVGPTVHEMNNTFIPKKDAEKELFPLQVPQDHAFARVLVNPQYAFKNLADSLNNLLDANPAKSEYLVDPCNTYAKAAQQPCCYDGTVEECQDY